MSKLLITTIINIHREEISTVFKELHQHRIKRSSGRCVWCKNYLQPCSCDSSDTRPKYPEQEAIDEYEYYFPICVNGILL
jgi:hypothetical protein